MSELQVSILTPAKVVGKLTAKMVEVPGKDGILGILPAHARLIAELGIGEIKVSAENEPQVFFVAGGYVEVEKDHIKVLADVAERAGDINVKRAEQAKARALDRLNEKAGVDVMRAQASLLRAETRLTIAGQRK